MDKYDMRTYIEKNFDRIIEDHFKELKREFIYFNGKFGVIIDNIDTLNFYKAWKESPNFKATVFLEEIEGDGEDSKDKKGTEL
ncbi:hypothetical protein K8P03_04955 [Anaerococcus murdochii]|uniref:Uncharacterized protein n=1 Tax=Anaerococcus murdochii TaxID=411577 RepID=A0ABS7SYR2_9FIRM|nr:hypothetical protein [Anaerococcus murdochii]MBZ2386646.1 hypothetical protein [Anaerococcus murdochii]